LKKEAKEKNFFLNLFGAKKKSVVLLLSCVPMVASVTLRDAERFGAKKEAKFRVP
jgi:hypothetical protein